MKTRMIRVNTEDVKKMRTECLQIYTDAHPERKGEKISDREMFKSLISFYTHN